MLYLALAVIGFVLIHLSDPVALRRIPLAKPALWAIGMGLLFFSAVNAYLSTDKFVLPAWAVSLGWILLGVSSALVFLSLFVNLPFRRTYLATGVGDRLVTSGLYALTRHPGVFCTVLLVVALILVSRSYLVLVAAPLVIALDIVLVAIQDRFFFGRMFAGYDEYRKHTPMLVPNGKSVKTFIVWLKQTRPLGR